MTDPSTETEAERLERVAADSWYAQGVNAATIYYSGRIFARHWRGDSCLELGPAEGLMTEQIAPHFPRLVLVDGSASFVAQLKERYPDAEVHEALFEDFTTEERFDTIVLGHVLEHVEDPVAILRRCRDEWLAPGGRVLMAVPNARSLHRQAAVIMGLLKDEFEFNKNDLHHGHRRVYTPEGLRSDVLAAGLRIEIFGGYWLKPLSNSQLEQDWTPEMIEAFMALGERYPDIAGEIYIVAGAD
ncbi:class I SAM-dependent methyltransferase [Solirubrobacter sp. CPCC 204708]|uniref:Class I SAM-dependent methyltransferase n=1 Tax=Solirubrobacter deserti TaxID=2282478 RepID=A0ABT4RMM5_9ACTN|nr:class I SAM-dependent methyltransferase [Solirubrobacter deserti]MBE2316899.1 class I SAM-dependent methyltransferase [Solirubrobacter deserti]MDA0139730.1 class I SAM-dependent methyltransferase [Solirubrobacter deserti]